MSEKYHVGAGVGVIVVRDDQVLVSKRKGAHGSATWAPPGGKIDYGERPPHTATREAAEEVGIFLESVVRIGDTNDVFTEDRLHYITLWFIGKIAVESPEPRILEPDKCDELRWIPYQQFLYSDDFDWFLTVRNLQKDAEMIQKIEDYIN